MRDLETMREQNNHKRDIKRERKEARDMKRKQQNSAIASEHGKRIAARDAANTPWERN